MTYSCLIDAQKYPKQLDFDISELEQRKETVSFYM